MTVIGIVGDVHQDGIDRPADLQVYMPLNQKAIIDYYRLVARTTVSPLSAERAIRKVFDTIDPSSPVYHVKPLTSYYFERLANRTFALTLFAVLGVMAMALAAVDIYGVVSYSVAQQIKEIGIRIAVGATTNHIFMRFSRQVAPLIAAGLAIGFVASLSLSRLMSNLLFQVAPADPFTFVAAGALLGAVALAAAAPPSRRAAMVDPMMSLRSE